MNDRFILFDNSALTRLFEEEGEDREALVASLNELGRVNLTALNVYETVRTPDPRLRQSKLAFYHRVSRGADPIADPMAVLASAAREWRFDVIAGIPVDRVAKQMMVVPETAGNMISEELTRWSKEQERMFADSHLRVRQVFDMLYGGKHAFGDERDFIETMLAAAPFIIHPLIAEPFRLWTNTSLDPTETAELLDDSPAWQVFVAAQMHALWLRSVNTAVASWKRTGIFDTDSAVYLPYCDAFITSDHAQFATLSTANVFNPRPTKVELFADLRGRLMI